MQQFDSYLNKLQQNLKKGDATEHTHRPALKDLLESLEDNLTATNEPKRNADVGMPDYAISRAEIPVGHVEAKDIGENLKKGERSAQLKRYRQRLPNLVFTDYLEFRHYVDGELRQTATLAEHDGNGKLHSSKDGEKEVESLLRSFFAVEAPVVSNPEELARRMAGLSLQVRDAIAGIFRKEPEKGALHSQLQAFRKTLIPGLEPDAFADMYAQTIAYGLFAARTSTNKAGSFSRYSAASDLPRTNPFLRGLFGSIAGSDLDERVTYSMDALAELLRKSDMEAIVADFGRRTRREDPVVHFYETFLAAYDPKLREARGVYYTPEPVVSYIVRSVDKILREKFNRRDALADGKTLILDPATGTGTFLYYAIRRIYEHLQEKGQGGTWDPYVQENLLPRLFGFELLMAPYTVAHMKLAILLSELGAGLGRDSERLGVYLTNTLEEGVHSREQLPFLEYIAEEADAATEVKNEQPIEVILGNPPYSGHSANTGKWIKSLIGDYKYVDGEPLGERNPKWLNDDYVKFIRFGQWRVDETGQGILAFVTNHGYLENPTFRGMRQSLMETFTDIYFLDLHGNSKKKEKTPEGGRDENVFDIQQGVSIGILVKEPGKEGPARVHHADLWGERENKYEWLSGQDVETTEWEVIEPDSPQYLFDPQNANLLAEYERGWKVTEMMPVNTVGIVTGQDKKTISFTPEQTRTLAYQQELSEDTVTSILYRPFDQRFITYDTKLVTRPRIKVMRHMLANQNLALVSARSNKSQTPDHFFCSSLPTEAKTGEATTQSNILPLYLYPTNENLFDVAETERKPNLSPEFVWELSERLGLRFVPDGTGDLSETFGPEGIFHYAYAVFHAPSYRERYAEFLKRDFPRLPLTDDRELFSTLAGKGAELVGLHLMRSTALDEFITGFPVSGDNTVEKVRYAASEGEDAGRVYINATQYFEGMPEDVWEFRVGGYQVLDKWLKDRKERALTFKDINHYQRVVVALSETRRLMEEIDGTIPGWPIA